MVIALLDIAPAVWFAFLIGFMSGMLAGLMALALFTEGDR